MIVCLVLALAGSLSLGVPRATALPVLSHHGRWLTDPQGRVVVLHGLQIDKYMPTQPVEYIDLNPANVALMEAEGFNLARVSFALAGYEPTLGGFDQSYLNSYLAFDRRLAQSGIYDLLDMMQGQYSAELNGWGFPNWMTITDGLPNGKQPFPQGYFANLAEDRAWDNLYADAHASDGVGLQEHYAASLARIAGQFASAPGLLGVEILNEPWAGSSAGTCASPAGCPPGGFDQTSLTNFSRRMVQAVRAADPRHLIAYEPNLLFDFGAATGLGAIGDPNLVFAYHNYCLAYFTTPGSQPPACATDELRTISNADAYQQGTGVGLLMDEWGNTTDTNTITRVAAEADQEMVGWSYWALEDCCNSPAAVVKDGTKPPTTPGNLRTAVLDALVRPYPQTIAGTPVSWTYDPDTRHFSTTFTTALPNGNPAGGLTSDIFIPRLQYPHGYRVTITGAGIVEGTDSQHLLLRACPNTRSITVVVTPGSSSQTASCQFGAVTQSCPRPSGRLARRALGPLTLGMKRAAARHRLERYATRGHRNMDFFCLTPMGIRAGYPSPRLLATLSRSERRRVRDRIVLLLTAARSYALRGVRPGARLATIARRLNVGSGFHIGLNRWYLQPNGPSRGVLKVRHGIIQEIGIAEKQLTQDRPTARRFLSSFS